MNFYKTTAAFGVTACLLMATSAYGTDIERETFEITLTDGTGWLATGNDATQATLDQAVTAPAPAGFPTGATSSSKVLSISGSATRTYSGADTDPFVDMMVKVSVPDEALSALATGTGGDAEGAKFAVAVDAVANETTGQFKYWDGEGEQWTPLSTEQFAADAWVRVTMKFDYTANKCTVALNGNTCGTYDLIGAASTLASVQIKGDTAIDEVVVAQGSVPAFAGDEAIATGATATKKWLTANDVTWPASNDTDAIAKLNAQYIFGLAPDTSSTAATTLPLSFVQDDSTTTAKLSFPGFGAYGGTGTYVLQSKTASTDWANTKDTITSAAGVNTASVTLPSTAGTAVYYRIKANPASN